MSRPREIQIGDWSLWTIRRLAVSVSPWDPQAGKGTHPIKQLKHELQIRHRCEELPLELLGETAVTEYLAERFPRNSFPANFSGTIYRQTEGNRRTSN
ncbi:MAG TPA: hypothetical protein VGC61_06695 [Pyrinomonadaceae bacterium]